MSRPKPSSIENGRLSKGPATQAGKDRSKLNATRHGLLSANPVIEGEDPEQFNRLVAALKKHFQPESEIEEDYVLQIADARWRLRRIQSIEKSLMEQALFQQTGDDFEQNISAAFNEVAEGRTMSLLLRYQASFEMSMKRAQSALLQLRKNFPAPQTSVWDRIGEDFFNAKSASTPEQEPVAVPAQPQPVPVPQPPATAPYQPVDLETLWAAVGKPIPHRPNDRPLSSVHAA